MGFGADMDKWKAKTVNKMNNTVKFVCFNISNSIILLTPVDTGAAKNNWQASIGSPDRSTDSAADKSGLGAIKKANDAAKQAAGNIFYLTNSLPYIKRLEEGHSKQSKLMVTRTVAAWKAYLSRGLRQ